MSILNKSYFHDEAEAFAKVESNLWPDGPVCPHCGAMGRIYALKDVRSRPTRKHPKGVVRHGLKKCGDCRKQFTVRVGTIFEDSHAPLHKWLQAIHLLCASKKGISSHQLHRMLEVQYKTAWFMSHRIREAMRTGSLSPMGNPSGFVEVDETIYGKRDAVPHRDASGPRDRNIVLTLVNRQGEARSFHIDHANGETIVPIVRANVIAEAKIATDQALYYTGLDVGFAGHESVNHAAEEWVRGEITTNTVEGYFALFKRGMKGVYQHCSEKHLHRYLAEFDFRYSNRSALGVEDADRAIRAIKGAKGKRLTYRTTGRSQSATGSEDAPPF